MCGGNGDGEGRIFPANLAFHHCPSDPQAIVKAGKPLSVEKMEVLLIVAGQEPPPPPPRRDRTERRPAMWSVCSRVYFSVQGKVLVAFELLTAVAESAAGLHRQQRAKAMPALPPLAPDVFRLVHMALQEQGSSRIPPPPNPICCKCAVLLSSKTSLSLQIKCSGKMTAKQEKTGGSRSGDLWLSSLSGGNEACQLMDEWLVVPKSDGKGKDCR